jgi:hypothetical protein
MNSTNPSSKSRTSSDPGPGGLDRAVFRCFQHGGFRVNWRLVCQPAQAFVESACVGLRPGVDLALRDDGDRGLAVWREGGWKAQGQALGLFLLLWVLNVLWTPLFFGMHRPGLAFVEISALWLVLAATLVRFWRLRKAAGGDRKLAFVENETDRHNTKKAEGERP